MAEVYAKVTGSVGATYRVDHRDPVTGKIVVDSEVTYGQVKAVPRWWCHCWMRDEEGECDCEPGEAPWLHAPEEEKK